MEQNEKTNTERTTVEIDGAFYYEDTGEFAGFPTGGPFLPDVLRDEADLNLYLEKLLNEEAGLLAEQTRLDALIAAIRKNCEPTINARRRRVEWLRQRFDHQAQELAIGLLPKKADGTFKTKTWSCPFGKVSFKTKPASLAVVDAERAIAYAESIGFDECVKVEKSFLISQLPADVRDALMNDPFYAADNGFEPRPAREVPAVQTGVTGSIKE